MSADTLQSILEPRRSQPHQLIEALQDVQELYGYIPQDAAMTVAKELGVPPVDVYSVASFYKAFTLSPKGKHMITVCSGTACHVRGADSMVSQIQAQLGIEPGGTTDDRLFSVESVNCLGACALGPVVVLDGEYHDHMTPAKLRKLVRRIQKQERQADSDG